jgi:hypothetical protein
MLDGLCLVTLVSPKFINDLPKDLSVVIFAEFVSLLFLFCLRLVIELL